MENNKKTKTDESEGTTDDESLISAIGQLQEVQDEIERVNEEASDKVLEVEQKYNEIRRPIYKKRNDAIKDIPDFWLIALQSHPILGSYITEDDQEVFKYLLAIDVEDFQDLKSGYSISFTFKPNPYFEEEKLSKVFSYLPDGTAKITSIKPHWKPGMASGSNGQENSGNVDKEGEKEGTKRKRDSESFFKWFDVDNPEAEEEGFQLFDEIADILKDDLWPNPLRYFNQEGDEEDFNEDEEDDDEANLHDEDEDQDGKSEDAED